MASLHLISISILKESERVLYCLKWKFITMATNFGSMTIPELRKELEKFGAKKSGRKRELVERLEAYTRNAHCSRTDLTAAQDYVMVLPDPQKYEDLNSDKNFPGCNMDNITTYLAQFNKNLESKAKNLYNDGFIKYIRTTENNALWYVRSAIRAEMSKSVVYTIDIVMENDGNIAECQCECAAGMGPLAHCKHICTALFACLSFKTHGSVKTEQTCTQRLQTFHRVRPHRGTPMKADNLDMPGCDEICNFADGFDPRPVEYRNNLGYKSYFQNVCLSYPGVSKTPIFQTFPPANMRGIDVDHDYFSLQGSYAYLNEINVSQITEEEARILNLNTAKQAACNMWHEERCKRLHASVFGRICKMTDRTDKVKLAETLVTKQRKLHSAPILHGQKFKKVAIKKFQDITGHTVYDTGICVSLTNPYLAASPDGIIDEDTVVEVKCPYVARNEMISRQTVPYIRQNDGKFSLDKNHDYYYQVQGQLFCAEKKICYFIVYTFNDILFFPIQRNDNFISEMIRKLNIFYENHFRTAVLEKNYFKSYEDCHCSK
ncbi:uncharacterized protein LOC134259793 [Saccostrea cucullata]|uniref:uncharacterized protein LOC134259793 n=1 Tax=Saccostrea cuccullata TaxID=36930 RepID=UPI002ED1C884